MVGRRLAAAVAQVAAAALVEEVAASQQPSRHGLLNVQARRAYLYIRMQWYKVVVVNTENTMNQTLKIKSTKVSGS